MRSADAPSDNTKAFYAMLADCNDYAERNSLLDSEEEEEEEDN
jgi:hypothetical protein